MNDSHYRRGVKLASNPPASQPTRRQALKLIAAAAGGLFAAQREASAAINSSEPATTSAAPGAGSISIESSSAHFDAANPTLPHGGVRGGNTGEHNDAALDELFKRVRASSADRKYIQMPSGTLPLAGTFSPSGKTPGKGLRAPFLQIDFPNTLLLAAGDPANYMPIQLCGEGGQFLDMDHFSNTRAKEQQVPWSKSLDTVWINDDESGTLKKMRTLFNCRNCEGLHLSGTLTLDCNSVPNLVGLASSGGGGGRTGMFRGMINNLRIEKAAVGILAGNFGASPDNNGIADHFTDVTIGLLELRNGVQAGFVGHSNHFDNLTINKIGMACPHNSYLCGTHNITIGSGFMNVPKGTKSHRQLVLMGTNVRMCNIYFNSGGGPPWPSAGHILVSERTVLDIMYHNDISKATTTGCHLALGRAPSGVNCVSASLTARVDIRSALGVKSPEKGVNPGMLWMDTNGGLKCRRQVDLYLGAQRADYDIVKIEGTGTTNDKITLWDVRDDVGYGKTRKIVNGALALWS